MSNVDVDFFKRLSNGPAVLFLGQKLLSLNDGADPLLSEVYRKFPESKKPFQNDYDNILIPSSDIPSDYYLSWLKERCRRISTPDWLNTVGNYSWSSIFTSAIDTVWIQPFNLDWRELHPIYEEKFKPSDPRNRLRLHCTFLFGSVGRIDETEQAPITRIELIKRRLTAVALARRIPEVLTPFGTLVIEGYSNNDWFRSEEFFPILDQLGPSQIHLFSSTFLTGEDPLLAELVSSGKLVLHEEPLASSLLKGETGGWIKVGPISDDGHQKDNITIGHNVVKIPLGLRTQISRSCNILDNSILEPPNPISEEKRYQEFRDFLSQSSQKPNWTGYARGFAFRRSFEKELRKKVIDSLKNAGNIHKPIILHGQTGTGKTVAMGHLAYHVKKNLKYPVLFIEKKTNRPNYSDISNFCEWAEVAGAEATLIVWDGMLEIEQYDDLVNFLLSRGRKAIVVGTCYYQKNLLKHIDVEAIAKFEDNEFDDLKRFISSFDPNLDNYLQKFTSENSSNFLVALYRLIPASRGRVQEGVIGEIGYAEQEILKKSKLEPLKPFYTSLGQALLTAGVIDETKFKLEETQIFDGETVTRLETVIGLIMVPGSFGHNVPIELLVRTFGTVQAPSLIKILKEVDIFRWIEDEVGNIFIGPRQSLEAQLLVRSRLGSPAAEVSYASSLLLEIRGGENFLENVELNFAVDLVKSLGPNGQNPSLYKPFFPRISENLSQLRESRSVISPRLMLQEAFLLREYVKQTNPDLLVALDYLDNAKSILREALDYLPNDKKFNRLRSIILVELASTLGSIIQSSIQQNNSNHYVFKDLYNEFRDCLNDIRGLGQERQHAVDVLCWASIAMLKANVLDMETQVEVIAEVFHALDSINQDEIAIQDEKLNTRRIELGTLLNQPNISNQAFKNLEESGSAAGYYLKARKFIEKIDVNQPIMTAEDLKICEFTFNYLNQSPDFVQQDGRSSYLMLRLWWLIKSGNPIFYKERQPLPFNQQDWTYVVSLAERLIHSAEQYHLPSLLYLQAVAFFHLRNFERAISIFKEIGNEPEETLGRRRIVRSYLASNLDGTAQIFSGTVKWADPRKGEIFVEEIGRNIRFIPHDFGRTDFQVGETIPRFNIAFNFIGMIADSITPIRRRGE